VHRAYVARVPYEDLAVQLGETGPLDEAALAARVLSDGRGGYCFELNTLFAALLRGLGFSVAHHQAVVGGEGPTNHMALIVDVDGSPWLADAGLGEGFVEPLPLREGRHSLGPFTYTLTREPAGTWWMGQHEWSTFSGFRMQPAPS
jgi:N-hydroxyarylamine O-acetyltransferase